MLFEKFYEISGLKNLRIKIITRPWFYQHNHSRGEYRDQWTEFDPSQILPELCPGRTLW